jgi:hypothetical protein
MGNYQWAATPHVKTPLGSSAIALADYQLLELGKAREVHGGVGTGKPFTERMFCMWVSS